MNWSELLKFELDHAYKCTEGLFDLVDDSSLSWKPPTGDNWMTTEQLLMHLAQSAGVSFKGFITGDWGMPEGMDTGDMSPEDMLPPAEKMPKVDSVAEAKQLLSEDKQLAYEMLASCTEEDLDNRTAPAPWDPSELILGHRLLQMVEHLKQHKGQLFYYLKLQGKPVHTGHLWGM